MNPEPALFGILRRAFALVALLAVLVSVTGCKTTGRLNDPIIGAGYQPKNVYTTFDQLPISMRRVAVLPLTCDANTSEQQYGRQVLEVVLSEELGKTKKFELIPVTGEQLRVWTGRTSWRAEEKLPADLLKKLQQELGCDAVLFSRLTQYRAYPPLTVGFSLKLVEISTTEFFWVVDEVFDATEPGVVNSARRYQLTREHLPAALSDSRSILNSPSGFGRYAANSVFQTLPAR